MNSLFVPKRFNTYADTFLMLGIARVVEDALRRTKQKFGMQLLDEGSHYHIQFKRSIQLELLKKLEYTDMFPPVTSRTIKADSFPDNTTPFDTVLESEARQVYRNFIFENRGKVRTNEETPTPPDPRVQNGVSLTSLRHAKNHNDLWESGREIQDNYGYLVISLIESFSRKIYDTSSQDTEAVANLFKKYTNSKLPKSVSAVKIYLPTSVEGVNRIKADSNNNDRKEVDWLLLWLIANGFFTYGISEVIKVADRKYDRIAIALCPHDISLQRYEAVLDEFRKYETPNSSHGAARFDAELVIRFCQRLLKHHNSNADVDDQEDDFLIGQPINHFVGGFSCTHFGSKGQVYGVKSLFSLGLPSWIHPANFDELDGYQAVLKEHLLVLTSLSVDEGHSEILANYREFITSSNWDKFFEFQVSYADYVTARLSDVKAKPPRLFSISGLNIMTKKEISFTEITGNLHFQRIAKAINQSTVYAGKVGKKGGGTIDLDWQRTYGLAQRLRSQAGSKKDFLSEIAAFLSEYEHENMRISEKLLKDAKPLRRIWTTKEDLDWLIELVEKLDSAVLIANLLVAYGYARWTNPKAQDDVDAQIDLNIEEEFEESNEGDNDND